MRVVIASYYAPPDPAVASHRVLRLSRALLRAGHEVHWVTQDEQRLLARDETTAALIPPEVVVHGIGGPTLYSRPAARNLPEKVLRTLYHALPRVVALPDAHVEWAWRLRRRLPGIADEVRADAVLFCCGPHGQLLALPRLRRARPELRILVDYRDLLSGNTWTEVSSRRVRRGLLARERRILAQADMLFVNTEQAKARFLSAVGEVQGLPIAMMRNAADYALAGEVGARTPGVRLGDGLHLGYFGTIFERRRLLPVLRAMERLAPAELERVMLHCFCDSGESLRLLTEDLAAATAPVRERAARHELLSFGPALRTMQAMGALVLVNSPRAEDAIFVPGKIYDYLMARRPVLYVGCAGDARDIVARTSGESWCFGHEDVERLADHVRRLLAEPAPPVEPCSDFDPEHTFAPLLRALG